MKQTQTQVLTKSGKVDGRTTRKPTFRPGMKVDPTKAKRVEVFRSKTDSRPWKTYVFDCVKCGQAEVRVSSGALYTTQCMCRSCAGKKRPYEYILGTLKSTARHRNIDVSLTYEEFLEFVSVGECHYCGSHIPWLPHAVGENYPKAYYLDRIDNARGYSRDNCVPCCTACNFVRQDKLSYHEMLILAPGLREVMRRRHLKEISEFN